MQYYKFSSGENFQLGSSDSIAVDISAEDGLA